MTQPNPRAPIDLTSLSAQNKELERTSATLATEAQAALRKGDLEEAESLSVKLREAAKESERLVEEPVDAGDGRSLRAVE